MKHFFSGNKESPKNNRKKVGILLIVTSIGLFFLFAGRVMTIVGTGKVAQVNLKEKTQQLYHGEQIIPAKRGDILDRNGEVIATDATSYSIYAMLSKDYIGPGYQKLYAQEKDFDVLAEILKEHLGIDKEFALKQLNLNKTQGTKDNPINQVEFGIEGRNVNLEKKLQIEDALKEKNVHGLYFMEHPTRIYPNGNFASYLVGYAQLTDEEDESKGLSGMMGIEKVYNKELQGESGKITFEKDHSQNPIPGTVKEAKVAKDGKDIYTTLDSDLQGYLELHMDAVFKAAEPENLTSVMMNAKTGEILAMSQRPSFDPQVGFEKDSIYRNFIVEDAFEPGSTMKTMLLAGAINDGKFDPNQYYNNKGLKIYDTTINDHDFGAIGPLNMSQAYSWSSNIGMVLLEQKLGEARWKEYMKKFGFGQSTNSRLPNESKGTLPTDNPVNMAMSAFGQAVSVTGLQMLKAYSAMANGGEMVSPRYVEKVIDNYTGEVDQTEVEKSEPVIRPETATEVLNHMQDVVNDQKYGTGTMYAIDGYKVGAKTGTAQISENGAYLVGGNNFIFSVMMVAPADNPQYLIYSTIKKPKTFTYKELANISNTLMKRALDLQQTEDKSVTITLPDYVGTDTSLAKEDLEKNKLKPVIIGSGKVVKKQFTKPGKTLLPNSKVWLLTDGKLTMPDVKGWSKNDLLRLEEILGAKFEIIGDGKVSVQGLSVGKEITDKAIRIVMK